MIPKEVSCSFCSDSEVRDCWLHMITTVRRHKAVGASHTNAASIPNAHQHAWLSQCNREKGNACESTTRPPLLLLLELPFLLVL